MKDQSKTKQALIQELASLRQRIAELEQSESGRKLTEGEKQQHVVGLKGKSFTPSKIQVSGINVAWNADNGTCTFEDLPVAMMWVDTTLAGLMSGVQTMVGTDRFFLALQSEGRKSVEADWQVISNYPDFREGYKAIANIAAVAGWGYWELTSLNAERKECLFRIKDSWEGLYQKSLGVYWGSGMLAGKMAGYCSKLFGTNCWADQIAFIAKGDNYDEFVVKPSHRLIEKEIENLLASDAATRADMAVALRKLEKESTDRKRADTELRKTYEQLRAADEQMRAQYNSLIESERLLRESEERFKTLFEKSVDAQVLLDHEGKMLDCNDAHVKLFGLQGKSEILGHTPVDFAPEFQINGTPSSDIGKKIRATILEKGSARFEWLHQKHDPDRTPILTELSCNLIQIADRPMIHAVIRDITARKQAEDALRDSEERYRNVFENHAAVKLMIDPYDGSIIEANDAAADYYGWSNERLKQMKIQDINVLPPEDVKKEIENALAEKRTHFEFRHRRADGSIRDVEVFSSKIEVKGKPLLHSIIHDITYRKQAEEALRKSEEKYRAIIENMQEGYHEVDIKGNFTFINESMCKIMGYERDELLGMNNRQYADEENTRRVYQVYNRVYRTGEQVKNFEWQIIRKDGDRRDIDVSISLIRNVEGHPTGFRGIVRDTTDRKRAEEALRGREAKISSIFRAAPVGIGMVINRVIKEANDTLCAMIGYDEEELLEKDARILYPSDEDYEFVGREKYRQIAQKATGTVETRWRRKNVEIIDILLSSTAINPNDYSQGVTFTALDITARKQAEQELKEAEERYRSIFENAMEGIYRSTTDGKFIHVNPAMASIYGYESPEDMVQSVTDISTQVYENLNDREFFIETLEKNDHIEKYEYRIRKKNGNIIWVSNNARTVRDSDGNILYYEGLVQDITERKKTEEALRKSESTLRSVFATAPVGICIMKNRLYQSANAFWCQSFGYPEESIIGKDTRMLYENDEEFDRVGQVIYTHLRECGLASAETRLRRSDGVFRNVILTAAPLQKDDPTAGTVVIIHDVTDIKQAENGLRESEGKYRFITERMSDVIWTLDSNFGVQYVSPSISRALGFTQEERIKQTLFERITPESLKKVKDVLQFETQRDREKDVDPDRVVTLELEYYHKSGSTVWHETAISAIRDAGGNITGFHGASRDITERKNIEKERKGFEERLRRAEKMEAIGTLAGGIAHDFNNILGAILGYTEMALGERTLDNHLRRYLDQVFKAGERARDLVKQILAFSRKSDENPRPMRVGPIIKEVLKLLRASLPSTIKIRQEIHEDWDTVLADPAQIHQILMNLCTNAAYAMREGMGELKVSLVPVSVEMPDNLIVHHDLSPGKYLRLTVSDTGAGIDNEIMSRIFDPFFTTKKPGEGTGLGLSVVYGIVKNYGGAITAQSEVGKGTEFNVYLPLLTDVESKQEKKGEAPIAGGKERILFVDDEAALVELATSTLSGLGYEVTGRTSSLEALELFRTRPDSFDLVITDMTMPNMTGSELAQQLMRLRPDIPIILCTGFSEAITHEKARAIGVREFIMKPIVQRQIAEAIRRVLSVVSRDK